MKILITSVSSIWIMFKSWTVDSTNSFLWSVPHTKRTSPAEDINDAIMLSRMRVQRCYGPEQQLLNTFIENNFFSVGFSPCGFRYINSRWVTDPFVVSFTFCLECYNFWKMLIFVQQINPENMRLVSQIGKKLWRWTFAAELMRHVNRDTLYSHFLFSVGSSQSHHQYWSWNFWTC